MSQWSGNRHWSAMWRSTILGHACAQHGHGFCHVWKPIERGGVIGDLAPSRLPAASTGHTWPRYGQHRAGHANSGQDDPPAEGRPGKFRPEGTDSAGPVCGATANLCAPVAVLKRMDEHQPAGHGHGMDQRGYICLHHVSVGRADRTSGKKYPGGELPPAQWPAKPGSRAGPNTWYVHQTPVYGNELPHMILRTTSRNRLLLRKSVLCTRKQWSRRSTCNSRLFSTSLSRKCGVSVPCPRAMFRSRQGKNGAVRCTVGQNSTVPSQLH